ncbi:guanine nucleotide exchange protein for ADP-robosylation factor [Microbotryomycetes sp. JL221]|nr:guanine nucleotide exchange protein for ADP-robosylation factor [Microbotryomycetes sp. JL221]
MAEPGESSADSAARLPDLPPPPIDASSPTTSVDNDNNEDEVELESPQQQPRPLDHDDNAETTVESVVIDDNDATDTRDDASEQPSLTIPTASRVSDATDLLVTPESPTRRTDDETNEHNHLSVDDDGANAQHDIATDASSGLTPLDDDDNVQQPELGIANEQHERDDDTNATFEDVSLSKTPPPPPPQPYEQHPSASDGEPTTHQVDTSAINTDDVQSPIDKSDSNDGHTTAPAKDESQASSNTPATASTDAQVDSRQPPASDDAITAATTTAESSPAIATSSTDSSVPASPAPPQVAQGRRSSVASTATVSATGSSSLVSGVLIINSIESIAASKEAKRSKPLKDACDKALDTLKSPVQSISAPAGSAGTVDPRVVFTPLRLACETKSLGLMVTALDCIGKLVSSDFFVDGSSPQSQRHQQMQQETNDDGEPVGPVQNVDTMALPDLVTTTVCECFSPSPSSSSSSSSTNNSTPTTQHDQMLLRLLSCLLSLILSQSLEVHQAALLKAVRTVYNVFLLGKPGTVQTVAQATLGQIVGGVFGRVELGTTAAASNAMALSNNQGVNGASSSKSGMSSRSASVRGSRVDLTSVAEESTEEPLNLVEASLDPRDTPRVAAQTDVTKPELAATLNQDEPISSPEQNMTQDNIVHTPTLSSAPEVPQVVEPEQAAVEVNGETDSRPEPTPHPKAASAEHVTLATIENRRSFDGVRENVPTAFVSKNDLYVKDAFLVFRALCKLSMKPLGVESERDIKSHAMRSKLLSLHLVLSILQNHLAVFVDPNVVIISSSSRDRTPFIQAVKQYLCLALSRNAVSPVNQVFELSCEIFWRVLSGMRTKLKKEIEVLLNEIFMPILEMKSSTVRQKSLLLAVFGRLALDPQALVDIYLNYDCDRTSLDNIYERLINIVSKLVTINFPPSTDRPGPAVQSAVANSPFPLQGPSLSDDTKFSDPLSGGQPAEQQLKRQALENLVHVLKSLVSWAARGLTAANASVAAATAAAAAVNGNGNGMTASESSGSLSAIRQATSEDSRTASDTDLTSTSPGLSQILSSRASGGAATPDNQSQLLDDPSRFENAKQRKTTLLEGIKKFNFKPKRGVDFLIDTGFIRSREPKDIARFLLNADGLDKAQIGEYLGEGDQDNINTMHAFVDFMDFANLGFVDALRSFLQSFRLPGEAQKIDRFMLKFAERYTAGNPGVFANADTSYVLAFSVILLNTDLHNPQVKKPMSKQEFIRNNRGIDDGKDIDETMLNGIYDEISSNEIRMKDEVEAAGPASSSSGGGIANALATVGRDLQREAYVWQSEGMANRTEALFRTLVRGQRRGGASRGAAEQYYSASHFEHVKPMFEVAWMPILAGVSSPLQISDDMELVTLSLDGFKQAIKIACLFDLELERNAFVTTLSKFTFLNNFGEMKAKNVEAIKTLLDVAMVDGNYLKSSWRDVIVCVSQLERFQLITQGVDSQSVPELGRKPSIGSRRSTISSRSLRNSRPTDEVALETRSSHITITADMIFSSTPQLSGTAIVDFVKALSEVSWEEIQASGLAEQPRVFCLQKLVEISYYNMNRIRLEWSQIWLILGEHFNQVTCHTNAKVSFLALDSLRQLAMRFLEKEELANFKFQKDFLKPFEYAMVHNNHPDAREMVLQCLLQMIQARVENLRSGWRTMFGVFAAAAKIPSERIANQSFDLVQRVVAQHFPAVVEYGSFADLTVCITDFCKISKYQRVSLQSIELLKSLIPKMLTTPECPLSDEKRRREVTATDDPMLKFWFPLLFAFYDVIMNGEDLEVRKRALDYLFETLKKHGDTFTGEFWDTVCKEVLFPIFAVLRSRSDVSRFSTHEDMSVWLSTTMIQALRNLVDLFTFYFDVLARLMDKLLDLLVECICQGKCQGSQTSTSCLQQLLENNVDKLSPERWERIVSTFTHLFKTTTAYQLFDENLLLSPTSSEAAAAVQTPSTLAASNGFAPLSPAPRQGENEEQEQQPKPAAVPDRRRVFRQIIVKCVLQLLLIETTSELLQNESVYTTIPPSQLLRLMASLDESYRFARKFNADKDLRMALWKVGFMRDLPNLLRQESTSAATLVNVLLRMYNDKQSEHVQRRSEVVEVFAPLGLDVLANFVSLNPETQARNITAWTPVCAEILQGFCSFEDEPFKAQLPQLYPLATNVLAREVEASVREGVRAVFVKVGKTALRIGVSHDDDNTTERDGFDGHHDDDEGRRASSSDKQARRKSAGLEDVPEE